MQLLTQIALFTVFVVLVLMVQHEYHTGWEASLAVSSSGLLLAGPSPTSLSIAKKKKSSSWRGPGTDFVQETAPNTFGGLVARAFESWPTDRPLPCFAAEKDWSSYQRQNNGIVQEGFLFMRPLKCGSTSSIGLVLRMLNKQAKKKGYSNPQMCLIRFDHGWRQPPLGLRFQNRNPLASFLWTILRDPTPRTVSQYYFFKISHARIAPTDENLQAWLQTSKDVQDYYLKVLSTEEAYPGRGGNGTGGLTVAQNILDTYDFVGITERFDESAVVLMMLLHIPMGDILYLSVKQAGGFDYAWYDCMYVFKPYLSPAMVQYFESKEWQDRIQYDAALYRAANRSLDLTIDRLGRFTFQDQLHQFQNALKVANEKCASRVVNRCTEGGEKIGKAEHDCLWDNAACGMACLDEVAAELGLPMTM